MFLQLEREQDASIEGAFRGNGFDLRVAENAETMLDAEAKIEVLGDVSLDYLLDTGPSKKDLIEFRDERLRDIDASHGTWIEVVFGDASVLQSEMSAPFAVVVALTLGPEITKAAAE